VVTRRDLQAGGAIRPRPPTSEGPTPTSLSKLDACEEPNSPEEEFKHFGMDLEFLLRRKPVFRETLEGILFQPGDIVEHGERAEDEAG
jgi:hypothetical protein